VRDVRATPCRVLPRSVRSRRSRDPDAVHSGVADTLWLAPQQRPGGAGLGIFAERRRFDRRGPYRHVGAGPVLAVAGPRGPRACPACACERGRIDPRRTLRDAVARGAWLVAYSDQGTCAGNRRGLGGGTQDRREPQRHRVSTTGALGPVGLPTR